MSVISLIFLNSISCRGSSVIVETRPVDFVLRKSTRTGLRTVKSFYFVLPFLTWTLEICRTALDPRPVLTVRPLWSLVPFLFCVTNSIFYGHIKALISLIRNLTRIFPFSCWFRLFSFLSNVSTIFILIIVQDFEV